jgi:cytochrome c peroxidase
MRTTILLASCGLLLVAAVPEGRPWTEEETAILASLSLSNLEPLAPDATNRFAEDPDAAELGQRIFFDTRFSSNGEVSCATCHLPELDFQDGKALAEGVGTTARRTMPIASTARSTWLFWDGRKDSQWSQALGPLESSVEHGGSRTQYVHLVARHYRAEYERVFGPLPDLGGLPEHAGPVEAAEARAVWESLPAERREVVTRAFANIGKALAAYERKIEHGPTRFDRYVDALVATGREPEGLLDADEVAGARLFVGKAGCVSCHNGPLFTDDYFHNTGVPQVEGLPDLGRSDGATAVLADEFNCLSAYSDAAADQCVELDFIVADSDEMIRAFKTPSLRNVADRPPYMHAGQIATLDDVVRHYVQAPKAPAGRSELHAVRLSSREVSQLVAFLRSLSGPLATPPALLRAPR